MINKRAPRGAMRAALAVLAASVAGLGLSTPAFAQAAVQQRLPAASVSVGAPNLNIAPKRVIFERAQRTATVFVFNQGTAPVTIDVALIDNVMLPNGEIIPTSEARRRGGAAAALANGVKSARAMMLAAPTRVTLAAGKGKTIRLQLLPGARAAGEYRTHLTVTTVPTAQAGLTADNAATAADSADSLSFNVQSIFGLSIPLIVRSGAIATTGAIGPISLASDPARAGGAPTPVLLVPIRRSGAGSLYGNIEVRSGTGKKAELVGTVRGLGVYGELGQRDVRVPLTRRPRKGENLTVTYVGDEGTPASLLASGSFVAP